jgi:hypothetical protein
MNDLTSTLKLSIEFQQRERSLMRMYFYNAVAKKAHIRFHWELGNYRAYDQSSADGELWTIQYTAKEIHTKALKHLAAYYYCLEKIRILKKEL